MKNLAKMLHTLKCNKAHLQEMEKIRENRENPEVCLFYLESIITDPWESKHHKLWLAEAENFTKELAVDSPGEALSILNKALSLTRTISPLIQQHRCMKKLLISLIESM